MASIRSVVFFAFAAVAVQSAVAWDFNLPGLFGSSFGLNSLSSRNSVGGNIKLEKNAAITTVELGPFGGIQSKIVTPMIPSIPSIMKMANDGVNNILGGFGKGLSQLRGLVHDSINLQIEAFEKILDKLPSIDKMGADLIELVKKSGALMQKVVESGLVSMDKIREFAASVIKSSINKTLNAGATLIDLLQKAIETKLLLEKQAIELIRDAIVAGLHKAEGAVDVAVSNFLDAAVAAGKISNDVAEKLKDLLKQGASGSSTNTEAESTSNASANAGTTADASANAGTTADASANAGTTADASANTESETSANAAVSADAGVSGGADAGLNVGVTVNA